MPAPSVSLPRSGSQAPIPAPLQPQPAAERTLGEHVEGPLHARLARPLLGGGALPAGVAAGSGRAGPPVSPAPRRRMRTPAQSAGCCQRRRWTATACWYDSAGPARGAPGGGGAQGAPSAAHQDVMLWRRKELAGGGASPSATSWSGSKVDAASWVGASVKVCSGATGGQGGSWRQGREAGGHRRLLSCDAGAGWPAGWLRRGGAAGGMYARGGGGGGGSRASRQRRLQRRRQKLARGGSRQTAARQQRQAALVHPATHQGAQEGVVGLEGARQLVRHPQPRQEGARVAAVLEGREGGAGCAERGGAQARAGRRWRARSAAARAQAPGQGSLLLAALYHSSRRSSHRDIVMRMGASKGPMWWASDVRFPDTRRGASGGRHRAAPRTTRPLTCGGGAAHERQEQQHASEGHSAHTWEEGRGALAASRRPSSCRWSIELAVMVGCSSQH